MSLSDLLSEFVQHLHSADFHQLARRADQHGSFTRRRKLPLPSLIALMLCGMSKSVQAELDVFFAHLHQQAQLVRQVSEQAFAQARAKLSHEAIPALNDYLIARADADGWLARWQGLRLVAADASTVRFALRASHMPCAASADQIAFGLYLPGSEMMLAASLHSVHENERQMLFEHLERLGAEDLLLLDRGYPSRWLVALLNQRGIAFRMRVEMGGKSGFACVQQFRRSGLGEQIVTLPAPEHRDVIDYQCPATPPRVRLIRHVAPNGQVRVLMTNLFDTRRFPAAAFGDLYHQRWRIGVSGEGHIIQSVEVRPRPKDASLVAWEVPWRESKAVKPSDHVLNRSAATYQVVTCSERRSSLVTRFPVAETVDNVRRQQGPCGMRPIRRSSPATWYEGFCVNRRSPRCPAEKARRGGLSYNLEWEMDG